MRVLFIGDVVGGPGRRGLAATMPELRERHQPDFMIVNGENSAGGIGITEGTAADLFEAGADVITTGNHVYRHRDVYEYLDSEERIVRPANYPKGNPGRGHTIVTRGEQRIAVINLSGAVQLKVARSPFHEVDAILSRIEGEFDVAIVDFHAEVTSEKVAMGWYLDGRVTALIGTHTHVPTADARVLPGGTAYISDIGMTGPRDSIIGMSIETVLPRFTSHLPTRFQVAGGPVSLNAVVIEAERATGRASSITQVQQLVEVG